jgi:hypothetical protein
MLALVQQTFLAKKTADFHPRQGNLLQKKTFLQGSTKPLVTTQNRLEAS